jgi:parvulin-like peptidyl-prolyl isomerase
MVWQGVAVAALCVVTVAAGGRAAQAAADTDAEEGAAAVFATVDGTDITVEELEAGVQAGIRQRYFHGQVPEDGLAALRREVGQSLIDRVLLAREARRRDLRPETAWVDAQLKQLEARLRADPRWEPRRAALLADARRQLNDDSVIHQLKQQVEAVPAADAGAVREYYRDHPDKFTTPERVRVSMILLKVEPWAPGAGWAAAEEEAGRLLDQLRRGADFAELAQLHSADPSAVRGGDLGYVHRGMFSAETQRVIDELAPGSLSAPVRLLQGYALFRLDERVPPRLNDFAQAQDRARGLLRREQQEAAWEAVRARLRDKASIEIDETVLGAGE